MVIIKARPICSNLTALLSENKIQQLKNVCSCIHRNVCIAPNAINMGKNACNTIMTQNCILCNLISVNSLTGLYNVKTYLQAVSSESHK